MNNAEICYPLLFRNVYQPQKLLSINGLEAPHLIPHADVNDHLFEEPESAIKDNPGILKEENESGLGYPQDVDKSAVFPAVAFIGMLLVLLFLLNQYYKGRSKPKRKRSRMKKLQNVIYGFKHPTV